MKNTKMIKKNYEFKKFFSKGKFFYGKSIFMYIHKNSLNINKLGIAISRKQGKAVKRNRVKRLIRENYKVFEPKIGVGNNILIIINKNRNIEEITYYDIKNDFFQILKKAELIENQDKKDKIE